MSAFLLLLVKLNLAMGAAIVLVSLLRRSLRMLFGAPIAYAIWFLVPSAGTASLFPPRVAAPVPVTSVHVAAAPLSIIGHITRSAQPVAEQLTGQGSLMLPAIAVPSPAPAFAMPEPALLLFAAWVLGLLFMAAYLSRLQVRFHAAVRRGKAGPAVLGVLRPRIVTPDSFQERFTAQEQAAILAHERVHLARQDARINALAALLRCLCWFNPLIHLGARWLRIDQELACDATAVAGAISRRTYARALLKSQMVVTALPLGCNWPGSQHPLVERIALLQRKPPGAARRLAGACLVLLTATSAGLGAWAAQPPVAAKSMAARQPGAVVAALPAMVAAPDQTAGGPNQPVANANPTGSDNDVDASKNAPASRPVSAAPVAPLRATAAPNPVMTTNAEASADPATWLPAAPPLPKEMYASETGAASNDPPATPVQPPPNASPAVALNDQPVGPIRPTARALSVGPVQASLSTPPATPPKLDTNEPYNIRTCDMAAHNSGDGTLMGRVTSSTTVQVPFFGFCRKYGYWEKSYGKAGWGNAWTGYGGPCENHTHTIRSSIWGRYCPTEPWVTINLLFANPADASKMPLGKVVRLKGDPFVVTQNNVDYLGMENARVLYADPFGR